MQEAVGGRNTGAVTRVLGWILTGTALLLAGYSLYLWFFGLARLQSVFRDFATPPARLTVAVIGVPWLPFVCSLGALAAAIVAATVRSRVALIAACAILGAAVCLGGAPWLSLMSLIHSVSGE